MHLPYFRRALVVGSLLTLGFAPAAAVAKTHTSHQSRKSSRHLPRHGGGYVGTSSEKAGTLGLPVDLRVSADGKTMSRFDIQWSSQCSGATGRGTYGGLSITVNKKIAPNGFFGDTGSFTRDFGDGTHGLFKVNLSGHFASPQTAAGTFRVSVAVTDASGKQTNTCDSGNIAWIAGD